MPVSIWFRRVTGTALVILAVVIIGLGANCAPLFYQESQGKPLAFAWAVAKLEVTGADLVAVVPDATVLIQECCPAPLSKPLTDFMSARGWTYKDQMGAGIIYEKGNAQLTTTSRMFSRRYVVYRLNWTP